MSEDADERWFNELTRDSILEMASRPVAVLTIANAHGIPYSTLRDRVEKDDEFAQEFQKRRAALQATLVSNVMDRGDTDWRMHAHMLERLFPSGYAKERANQIRIDAPSFDWNLLGRVSEKDLPKREVKQIEAEAVEVDDSSS